MLQTKQPFLNAFQFKSIFRGNSSVLCVEENTFLFTHVKSNFRGNSSVFCVEENTFLFTHVKSNFFSITRFKSTYF